MVTHVTKFDKWLSKEENRKTINMIAIGVLILTCVSVYDYFYQLKNYNEQISFEVDDEYFEKIPLYYKLGDEETIYTLDNNNSFMEVDK